MMRRSVTTTLLISMALLGSACFHVGKAFPTRDVDHIQIGETTHGDVRGLFGEPWRMGLEDGQRTWTYGDYHYSLFGPAQTRDLVIRFDKQGRVSSYSFSSTRPEDRDR